MGQSRAPVLEAESQTDHEPKVKCPILGTSTKGWYVARGVGEGLALEYYAD